MSEGEVERGMWRNVKIYKYISPTDKITHRAIGDIFHPGQDVEGGAGSLCCDCSRFALACMCVRVCVCVCVCGRDNE